MKYKTIFYDFDKSPSTGRLDTHLAKSLLLLHLNIKGYRYSFLALQYQGINASRRLPLSRQSPGPLPCTKRTRPISSDLYRTSLVNKGFTIIWLLHVPYFFLWDTHEASHIIKHNNRQFIIRRS